MKINTISVKKKKISFCANYMKKLSTFLKQVDVFGRKTELKMAGHTKYKTILGGFLTLVLILLSTLLFVNFSSDMIYHNNPTVVFSEMFAPMPERSNFSKENNFFNFGVQYPSGIQFVDNSIYTPQVYLYVSDKTKNVINSSLIPFDRCSQADLPSDPVLNKYFAYPAGSNLSDMLCVKNLDQYYMEGSFDTDIYYALIIKIFLCTNKTSDPNAVVCKSPDEIKKKMGFFGLYYMDYLIDPKNFDQPGQSVGKGYFSPTSIGMTKSVARYIATTQISSNDGFIFNSFNYFTYPTFKQDDETLQIDSTNSGMAMKFVMRKHHNNMVYERRYKKLQNVLAEMGGFIQIMYLIFFAISMPFVSKKYFEKIINTVYNFESIEGTTKIFLKTKKIDKLPPPSVKGATGLNTTLKFMSSNSKSMGTDKEKEKSKEKFLNFFTSLSKKLPLKTTIMEFLKDFLWPFKRNNSQTILGSKLKRLKKGKHLIKQKLDISYILKKFYEVDKLKMVLLNENQYSLFEYLPKPVILKNAKINLCSTKNLKFINPEANDVTKIRKMYNAYQSIIKQNEISEMDKKLIELLDDNLREILDVIFNKFVIILLI